MTTNLIQERVDLARRGRTQHSPDMVQAERRLPAWVGHAWPTSRKVDPAQDGPVAERRRRHLGAI